MSKFSLILLGALLGIAVLPYIVIRQKKLPPGTNMMSEAYSFSSLDLLIDRTRLNPKTGRIEQEQVIFDRILSEIASAESYIIADFFLWNPWLGALDSETSVRPLAEELAGALINKRIQNPDIPILVITDPINKLYGQHAPEYFAAMESAGIGLVFTDLMKLPDSNRIYAPQARFWKLFIPEWTKPLIENPFDALGELISPAEFARLLYFKANHRKVLVTGRSDGRANLVVGSLNPADGSANHSNMAISVTGPIAQVAAASELELAHWSTVEDDTVMRQLIASIRLQLRRTGHLRDESRPSVAWRTEGAIRDEILAQLTPAGPGYRIDAAVFYFSDRLVVKAFKSAIRRGASVRVLMDANKDAFGREKAGIPNRQVAFELMKLSDTHSVEVRWAATHGEQFHTKALRVRGPEQDTLLLGSANWTRRNLANLNLEANVLLNGAGQTGDAFDAYFDSLWNGPESLDYAQYADERVFNYWLYRFQEWSGASTF
ncbi:MAG: phospholipase D-like domain-containing protein [Coraliomargarita sp.]